MRTFSLLDVAPTIANVLGISLPYSDGHILDIVGKWRCRNVVLIIVDSLGYDLYSYLEPNLKNINSLVQQGLLLRAKAVSNHTSPSIATILSGLLPEHHGIFDKKDAKESSLLSIPEIASSSGLKTAVVMEKTGAEVYQGLIDMTRGIPDDLGSEDFDQEACRLTLEVLAQRPRLVVTYFIGIDKTIHNGLGPEEIRKAALLIDQCVRNIAHIVDAETLLVLCGDHPVHAGELKRTHGPYYVALILSRGRASNSGYSVLR